MLIKKLITADDGKLLFINNICHQTLTIKLKIKD